MNVHCNDDMRTVIIKKTSELGNENNEVNFFKIGIIFNV